MSAPKAPDPTATANAQADMNTKTATTQYQLNATNQNTPYGNLSYKQIGTWEDGTPRFEATQSLNPEQQNLLDLSNKTQANLGQIGVDQSSKIANILNTPFSLDASRGKAISDIQSTFLNPQWNDNQSALETKLLNQGVRPGSEAYDKAMMSFSTDRQRAYDQMFLDSYDKGNTSALTERNQPLNEISALLSGSQVSQPNFVSTPQSSVAPVDYTGLVNQKYQGQVASNNAMMGGIFGLASAPLGGWAYGGYKNPFQTKAA